MKKNRNLINILSLVISVSFITIFLKKKYESCDGCGGCLYEKFTDSIKVEKIVYKNNSINYIIFKSTIDSNQKYQEDSCSLSYSIGKDFSKQEILDTIQNYAINGERIIKGSCTPYTIDKIKRIKK